MNLSKITVVVLMFVALALYPLVAGSYGLDLVTKIMILLTRSMP
jgi:hypothetical protein